MNHLLGESSLWLALAFALLQCLVPALGYSGQNPYLLAAARPAAWGQCCLVAISYACLTLAFAQSDFSLYYVAANSHPSLPLMYRLTAVWGAHEGSMLLWVMVLSIWTFAATLTRPANQTKQYNNRLQPLTLSILGLISAGFLGFILSTSNPFATTDTVLTGNDLNPLLQDPGFVFHPPMLYLGYVGFSTAFALTLAGLIARTTDTVWARLTRQYALAAWCCLTLGICLGSWWAYRVLGWGGFWFWDPVENASLLPWLTGTALIHMLVLIEKRDYGKNWAIILSIITFALSLLGTFLVRSGVLLSVHSFANDPERGMFLLLLLATVLTLSFFVYLVRAPKPQPIRFNPVSRETLLLINSVLLFVAAMTIVLATIYPIILESFQLASISVGAPYFNTVMAPLTLILLLLMGFAPLCRWQEQDKMKLWHLSYGKLLLSIVLSFIILSTTAHTFKLSALLSLTLSFWVICSIKDSWRFYPGMSLAHIGFAIMLIGIMLSSLLSIETDVILSPGKSTRVGPYQFVFIDTQGIRASNYRGVSATIEVLKKERHITNLYPEKRIYTVRNMVMTHAAIHPSLFRDLYVALGEPLEGSQWSLRIYYKPFIRLIWLGGLIMMVGGIIAIFKRRR